MHITQKKNKTKPTKEEICSTELWSVNLSKVNEQTVAHSVTKVNMTIHVQLSV